MFFESLQIQGLLYLDMNSNKFPNDGVKGNPSYALVLSRKLAWQENRKLGGRMESSGRREEKRDRVVIVLLEAATGSRAGRTPQALAHLALTAPQEAGSVVPPPSQADSAAES